MDELEQPAAPESAAEQTPAEQAPEEVNLDPDLLDEQTPEEEIEDDLDGVKVKGKKDLVEKLKAERLMQADYTRKTQAAAEERRAIEEMRTHLTAQAQLNSVMTEEVAALKAIDLEIAKYQDINWIGLIRSDPDNAEALSKQLKALQSQREQVSSAIASKHQTAVQQQQQSFAKLIERANGYLSREVKGWNQERSNALAEYAVKEGFPKEALSNITAHMPAFGKVLHKAEMYDRLVQRQAQTRAKPETQTAPVQTLTTQKAAAIRDPDKLSADEWLKWRNAQLKRK